MKSKSQVYERQFAQIGVALHRSMKLAADQNNAALARVITTASEALEMMVNDRTLRAAYQLAEAASLALKKCQFGVGAVKAKQALNEALNNANYWEGEESETE